MNSKKLFMRHTKRAFSERMLVAVASISMFMFIVEQVLIFVEKNQHLLKA
jgi:hypothetical protein